MQHVVSLCLTLALALCLALPALAAEPRLGAGDTGTITLSGMEDGAEATAYKVIDVRYDYTADSPEEPAYSWAAEAAAWVETNFPDYIGANGEVTKAYSEAGAEAMKALADKMAAAIRAGGITLGGTPASNNSLTGLAMGSYLILVEGGAKVYSPALVNVVPVWSDDAWTLPEQELEVTVKASSLTLEKTADKAQAAVGDTVTYTLRAAVPQYPANATNKGYILSDKLPDGLTLGAVTVQGVAADGSETTLTADTHYTQTTQDAARPDADNTPVSFKLEFIYNQISSYSSIKVTYTATVNKDAVVTTGNINNAYLDYNNDPYGDATWQTVADEKTVYTYGIQVKKTDGANQPLSGAEFTLSTDTDGENTIDFVGTNGVYHKAETGEAGAATVAVDGEGNLTLSGLDVGTYYLTETKAPGGYNKLSAPIEITITDAKNANGDAAPDGIVDDEGATTGYVQATVVNTQGFVLPTTGGMGTALFTIAGVVLMGASVLVLALFVRRRSSAK